MDNECLVSQIASLASWIKENMPEEVTDDGGIDVAIRIMEQRNDARRWARRLYRVARQAQEAILDLGRRTCYAYEYKESNWRGYLGANMLDAYDALDKVLGETDLEKQGG